MNITKTIEGTTATLAIEGKLSVATSPTLEQEIDSLPVEVTDFVIDLTDLEYISSAGLRVLVTTQKIAMQRGGTMTILHPSDDVFDIFEMTGLSDVFTIER